MRDGVFTIDPEITSALLAGLFVLRVSPLVTFGVAAGAFILPIAYLTDDAGASLQNSGRGWGYQLEAEARYDFTPSWSTGGGVRFWHAEAGGNNEFVNSASRSP